MGAAPFDGLASLREDDLNQVQRDSLSRCLISIAAAPPANRFIRHEALAFYPWRMPDYGVQGPAVADGT